MDGFFSAVGLLGVAFYIGSYALLQLGRLKGNGYPYAILNLLGASFVLISLMESWNLSSAIIQVTWISISVLGILRFWWLTRALRFTPEEQALISTRFPTLSRLEARKLLDIAGWEDVKPGAELTRQGAAVDRLSYVASGGVSVDVGGEIIAVVGPGQFIGEMGCLKQDPASATVRVSETSRLMTIQSEALRDLLARNPDMRPHVEFAFFGNIVSKLMATNSRLEQELRASRVEPTQSPLQASGPDAPGPKAAQA